MHLTHLLTRQALSHGGQAAHMREGSTVWGTHAQWACRSAALAHRLQATGLQEGERSGAVACATIRATWRCCGRPKGPGWWWCP